MRFFIAFMAICALTVPAYAGDADPEISPIQYGGLYSVKQISPKLFKEKLLPLIETAMKDGMITLSELNSIEAAAKATGSMGKDFLKAAKERSIEEKFQDVMSKAESTGTNLTDTLSKALQSGQFSDMLDSTMNKLLPKSDQTPQQKAPTQKPGSPEAPVEL